jgi:hypothetical protein
MDAQAQVCSKDLDSNTKSDGCTAQAAAQIWIPTQKVMDAHGQVAAKIWIPAQKVIDAQLKLQKRSGLQYQGDGLKSIVCCCNPP